MILAKFPATWIIRRFKCYSWIDSSKCDFQFSIRNASCRIAWFRESRKASWFSEGDRHTAGRRETRGGQSCRASAGCTATMRLGNAREQWTVRVRPCTVISLAAEVSANYLQLIAKPCRERRSYTLGQHRPPPWVRMTVYRVYRVTTSVVNAVTNVVARRT